MAKAARDGMARQNLDGARAGGVVLRPLRLRAQIDHVKTEIEQAERATFELRAQTRS